MAQNIVMRKRTKKERSTAKGKAVRKFPKSAQAILKKQKKRATKGKS